LVDNLLEVRNLSVSFKSRKGMIRAVRDLSFTLKRGEVLGIVGESGSGKSVSMNAVMGLIQDQNAEISGEVLLDGVDLLKKSDEELRAIRGKDIAMIFQDPMTALTPVYTIGWHIREQLQLHSDISNEDARNRAVELLEEVGIPDPDKRVDQFPHEFSGGMRQRAIIAMALSLNPKLLIADEPTTALDVTIQAQILELLERLRKRHNSSIIIITHDMGVISELSSEVLVMYAGRMVERSSKSSLFSNPLHPYTKGLMNSVPRVDRDRTARLETISGQPASILNLPSGCAFRNRCPAAHAACEQLPPFKSDLNGYGAACFLVSEGGVR
jgi:peptide/nickel transport system ATP-binding protein